MINVTVSLQVKKGTYYAVLYYNDKIKGYQYKWNSTKIKEVDKKQKRLHNKAKKEAENKAEEIRKSFEEELNNQNMKINSSITDSITQQKFSDYMREWAEKQKETKEETTSSTYKTNVTGIIAPYFDEVDVTLQDLQPIHIQNFYDYQYKRVLTKGKNKGKLVSKNTVFHYHQNIHKALNDAVQLGIIPYNPDNRTIVATPDDYIASYYNEEEAMELLEKVKNNPLEIIISIATCYGLRRSEILGLKWSAIDFTNNTITIKHKVTQATTEHKRVMVRKDKVKNKSSYRSLPLIDNIRDLLLKEKIRQNKNKKLYGNAYSNEDNYICVKDDGMLFKPDTITDKVPEFIESVGLRRITLHNLRHSCASILLANGISMKEIQEWLGHSSYNTTANIYAHLDTTAKEKSANTMSNILNKRKIA